ncbi:uncharacterized protein PGTG_01044 [Puccinia graminis f. sp. tritici CRL 75-36-700-3]|uniref:Uncharacterized protein n=1 Tax=Puccinia graminis f. sp. tritici (strain CRL 75-36-700-3 / race SCCL) TaxID=418459 RepID=E3JUI8_PUCGT|nr:uncharacterized protein PGTG_01044 [Puccinia graminis f. sp. tritici CRL 75-36-700-3]EFP75713.1 hypothetical protein PGTG_01044 [Puccinia graminis f. sp. tritici CRL 75-36-700-3]
MNRRGGQKSTPVQRHSGKSDCINQQGSNASVAGVVKQRPQLISEDQTGSAAAAQLAPQSKTIVEFSVAAVGNWEVSAPSELCRTSIEDECRVLSGGSSLSALIDDHRSNGNFGRWLGGGSRRAKALIDLKPQWLGGGSCQAKASIDQRGSNELGNGSKTGTSINQQ